MGKGRGGGVIVSEHGRTKSENGSSNPDRTPREETEEIMRGDK